MIPLNCLADTIYYEAAHEPYAGKVAVGQVVLNRAADPHYPNRICAVVYARRVREDGIKIAAFSWTLGAHWRVAVKDPLVYAQCVGIAWRMLHGELQSYLIDQKVQSYHTVDVHPRWHKRFVARIGRHLFYRG